MYLCTYVYLTSRYRTNNNYKYKRNPIFFLFFMNQKNDESFFRRLVPAFELSNLFALFLYFSPPFPAYFFHLYIQRSYIFNPINLLKYLQRRAFITSPSFSSFLPSFLSFFFSFCCTPPLSLFFSVNRIE